MFSSAMSPGGGKDWSASSTATATSAANASNTPTRADVFGRTVSTCVGSVAAMASVAAGEAAPFGPVGEAAVGIAAGMGLASCIAIGLTGAMARNSDELKAAYDLFGLTSPGGLVGASIGGAAYGNAGFELGRDLGGALSDAFNLGVDIAGFGLAGPGGVSTGSLLGFAADYKGLTFDQRDLAQYNAPAAPASNNDAGRSDDEDDAPDMPGEEDAPGYGDRDEDHDDERDNDRGGDDEDRGDFGDHEGRDGGGGEE